MARKITVDPVTRIEGHASVELNIDDNGKVESSVFKVMDFRGWESFLRGMQVEMMPSITPRICGTCSVTHHLASAKTVDKALNAAPPPAAVTIRKILNFGGYLHSHGVHLFALAGPDLLMGPDTPPNKRNIVGMVEIAPEIVKKALRVRSIGARITEEIGGRGTHPVSCVPGGLAMPLTKNRVATLRRLSQEGLELCVDLGKVLKSALLANKNLLLSLPLKYNNLGLTNRGMLELYDGDLRLRRTDGSTFDFPEDQWRDHLFESTSAVSYAKHVVCRTSGGDEAVYRAGPLSRLNCCDGIDTPQAHKELETFRALGGNPCNFTVMYHYARLIELLYAAEKLAELVKLDEISSDHVRNAPQGTPHSATSIVEAPRGTLIHDYRVNPEGIVTDVNLIVATQQNIPAINATIGLSAEKFVDQPDQVLLNSIEFGVRCYDPCLSCATHRIGEMKLDVSICRNGQLVRRVRR